MQLSWKRGFLRVWAVLAIIWVALFGWREYSAHWWWMDPVVHADGECWDRLAKWSDGKPFDQWDAFSNEAPPGSINQRDRWRKSVREKIRACEDAKPLVQRWTAWANDNYVALENSLILVLLPPFLLLFFGFCVGWIVSGFKPKAF
jgi:hypothetical protein